MNCATCGRTNAAEKCYRCEMWLCSRCMREYEGYLVCGACYTEYTGLVVFEPNRELEEDDE